MIRQVEFGLVLVLKWSGDWRQIYINWRGGKSRICMSDCCEVWCWSTYKLVIFGRESYHILLLWLGRKFIDDFYLIRIHLFKFIGVKVHFYISWWNQKIRD